MIVGTLEVTAIDPDADDGVVFDPIRVTDGIEPSNDPVLRYRPAVYACRTPAGPPASVSRR